MAYKRRLGTMGLQVRVEDGHAAQISPAQQALMVGLPFVGVPKTVFLVRHGEAEHNPTADWGMRDPSLTELGRKQARNLRNDAMLKPILTGLEGVRLVVVSPLRRCLETARALFEGLSDCKAKIVAHPDIQETSDTQCDTGHPKSVLAAEFPEVDFDLVPEDWYDKKLKGNELVAVRLGRFNRWLCGRGEVKILCIGHLNSLRELTGGLHLGNCAVAVYKFGHNGWWDSNKPPSTSSTSSQASVLKPSPHTAISLTPSALIKATRRLFTSPSPTPDNNSHTLTSTNLKNHMGSSDKTTPTPERTSSSSSVFGAPNYAARSGIPLATASHHGSADSSHNIAHGVPPESARSGSTDSSHHVAASRHHSPIAARNTSRPPLPAHSNTLDHSVHVQDLAQRLFKGICDEIYQGARLKALSRSQLMEGLLRVGGLDAAGIDMLITLAAEEARAKRNSSQLDAITEQDLTNALENEELFRFRAQASRRLASQGLSISRLRSSLRLDASFNNTNNTEEPLPLPHQAPPLPRSGSQYSSSHAHQLAGSRGSEDDKKEPAQDGAKSHGSQQLTENSKFGSAPASAKSHGSDPYGSVPQSTKSRFGSAPESAKSHGSDPYGSFPQSAKSLGSLPNGSIKGGSAISSPAYRIIYTPDQTPLRARDVTSAAQAQTNRKMDVDTSNANVAQSGGWLGAGISGLYKDGSTGATSQNTDAFQKDGEDRRGLLSGGRGAGGGNDVTSPSAEYDTKLSLKRKADAMVEVLRKRNQSLEEENVELKKRLRAFTEQLEIANSRVSELEGTVEELTRAKEVAENARGDTQRTLQAAEIKLEASQREIDRLHAHMQSQWGSKYLSSSSVSKIRAISSSSQDRYAEAHKMDENAKADELKRKRDVELWWQQEEAEERRGHRKEQDVRAGLRRREEQKEKQEEADKRGKEEGIYAGSTTALGLGRKSLLDQVWIKEEAARKKEEDEETKKKILARERQKEQEHDKRKHDKLLKEARDQFALHGRDVVTAVNVSNVGYLYKLGSAVPVPVMDAPWVAAREHPAGQRQQQHQQQQQLLEHQQQQKSKQAIPAADSPDNPPPDRANVSPPEAIAREATAAETAPPVEQP